MKLFSFLSGNKPNPVRLPSPEEVLRDYSTLVKDIEEILPARAAELFRPFALRYAHFVYDLPASEDHHHAERFGLLRHSLETALEAVRSAVSGVNFEYLDSGVIDSVKTERNRPRHIYAEALLGLCHDAGKVFDVDAKVDYELWNPAREGLYSFLERRKATGYELNWLSGRLDIHAHRRVVVLRGMVSDGDVEFLGREAFLRFESRLVSEEVRTADADVTSVKADVKSVEARQPMPREQAFLQSLRELVKQAILKLNRPRGNVFVGTDYTFLVAPEPLERVIDHMRTVKGVFVSRQHDLVEYLGSRGIVREKDGRNFFKAELTSAGLPPVKLGGVFVSNASLWGEAVPALFAGTVRTPLDPGFTFRKRDHEEGQGGTGHEKEG